MGSRRTSQMGSDRPSMGPRIGNLPGSGGRGPRAQDLITVSIPPLCDCTSLVAGYDPNDGSLRVLNLGTLNELQVVAEKAFTLDRVDCRDGVQFTIPENTGVGVFDPGTDIITVPTGETWYLCAHRICIDENEDLTGGQVTLNFCVSKFAGVDPCADKLYYESINGEIVTADWENILVGDVCDYRLEIVGCYDCSGAGSTGPNRECWPYDNDRCFEKVPVKRDFRDPQELNTELRLTSGDTIKPVITVTEKITGSGMGVTFCVWGRKGKTLVEV